MSDLFALTDKRVLVTGGTQGLGYMIAEQFLRQGAQVTITSRTLETSERVAAALGGLGPCTGIAADLSQCDGALMLADQLKAKGEPLHILINNAGKSAGGRIETLPDQSWPELMSINVQAPFTLIRELLPLLRDAATPEDPARIVNIGSFAGHAVPLGPTFSYSASKAAIHHLTRILAAELATAHIAVNAVAPGYFLTPMTAAVDPEHMAAIPKLVPLGRFGSASDIAGACVYLCSKAGAYVTGIVLPVDGGLSRARR